MLKIKSTLALLALLAGVTHAAPDAKEILLQADMARGGGLRRLGEGFEVALAKFGRDRQPAWFTVVFHAFHYETSATQAPVPSFRGVRRRCIGGPGVR